MGKPQPPWHLVQVQTQPRGPAGSREPRAGGGGDGVRRGQQKTTGDDREWKTEDRRLRTADPGPSLPGRGGTGSAADLHRAEGASAGEPQGGDPWRLRRDPAPPSPHTPVSPELPGEVLREGRSAPRDPAIRHRPRGKQGCRQEPGRSPARKGRWPGLR